MKNKKVIAIAFALLAILFLVLAKSIFQTNNAGYFQVKQAAITGDMTVRFDAGTYFQWFGNISEYKNVATCGIGAHAGEGSADIVAVPVIFNDGSKADISALIRVKLPTTVEGAIALKKEYAQGYEHFIRSGIVPIVQNAIKLGANLRSAQDAYTTLALFQQAVEDQLRHGIYVTKSDKIERTTSTGDVEEQRVTVLVYDTVTGQPLRTPNRLQQLGCEVLECVIDVPQFDAKVDEMIAARKDEAMKTELAKQSAIRAKQDALTAEEQGKANVATAKYKEEVVKIAAVTVAQKEYEVAALNAKKALEEKKAVIAVGEGEAERNRLKVKAGLTPQEKVEWEYKTRVGVAGELAKVNVPSIVIGGGSGGSSSGVSPMDAIGVNMLLDIMTKLEKK
jgi:putative transposon-encoded protein